MEPDHAADREPAWGAPSPRRTWSTRQTLAAIGVAAVIAAIGGVAVYAATSGDSNTSAAMHGQGPVPQGGPGMGGPDGPGGMRGPGMTPLHGEFVVADGSGGYVTELRQTGTVTAVSDTSITVKSEDGFSWTYTRAAGAEASNPQLAVDDTVTVRGTLVNGTATATAIFEGDGPSMAGPGFGGHPRPSMGGT